MERGQLCDAEQLTRLAREGDIEVLDALTRCYGERLFAIGRKYCRSSEDAQDAVQDAMVSASTQLGAWRGDGALESWVGRMVANACHRMTRGRKNDPTLHEVEVDLAVGDTPELNVRRGELATALGEALLSISPRDRVIVLLSETEDWRATEIAADLNMSPAAVRQALHRARGHLRQRLVREDFLS